MNFYCWSDTYGRFKFGAKTEDGKMCVLGDMTFEWAKFAFGPEVTKAAGVATFENPCRLAVLVS